MDKQSMVLGMLLGSGESGGGGGTKDYEQLNNLPKINDVELKGNKSLSDLGISNVTINNHGIVL